MVKIAKTTGKNKHAGAAKESVSKSNPRRKATRKRRSEPAVAVGEDTATPKASTNPRQQMPRQRDWRYRDTVNLHEPRGDDGCFPEKWESPEQQATGPQLQPAERKPRPQRSVLGGQGTQYSPEYTDDEEEQVNEEFIETGEHIDEYDDRDLEGVEKLRLDKDEVEPPEDEPIEMRDFMRLLRQEGGVFVPWRLRQIVNTGDAAIILGQIMYWFDSSRTTGRTRAGIWRHDRLWIFKTHVELGRETGIKPRQVAAGLKFLKQKGFIERRYHRANGLRTTYIALNHDEVYKAMWETEQNRRRNVGAT